MRNILKKEKNIIINENGTMYEKHCVYHAGLATSEGYFRISDEDADRTLIITLIGGIFGLHHFLRGDYYRGLIYLLTGGGFGILYISDVIKIIIGNYAYFDAKYEIEEYGRNVRKKEKVYLSAIEDIRLKITAIPASIIICLIIVFLIYIPGYQNVNRIFAESTSVVIENAVNTVNSEN